MTIMRVGKTLSSPSNGTSQKNNKKLDPQSIIACGNLVKSPPYDKIKSSVSRWHMRWLVLYDTKCGIEIYYYKKSEYQEAGDKPLGNIILKNASVAAHLGHLHGFEYAIDIHTDERLWHLCTNDKPTHDTWLERLKNCCPPKPTFELQKTSLLLREPLQFPPNTIPELNPTNLEQLDQSFNSQSPTEARSKKDMPLDTSCLPSDNTKFDGCLLTIDLKNKESPSCEIPRPTSIYFDQDCKQQKKDRLSFSQNSPTNFLKKYIVCDEIFGASVFQGPKLKKNSKKKYFKSRSCDDLLTIDSPKNTINNNSKER